MKTKQILDIFSKTKSTRKEKQDKKPKVIIDYREKNSLVASELSALGFEIEFKTLNVADYIVNDVAIERKTVSDFISSMINRRLIKQLEEIQQYKNRLLLIEGIEEQELYSERFSEENIGMHPNSVRGFLLSILLKYKVPIIFTKNSEDTSRFLMVLSKRKEKELPLNVSKRSLNQKEQMQFIVESFPGIGPKTARKLLEKFGSIKNIINSSEEEIRGVIGKKAEVFRIVDTDY